VQVEEILAELKAKGRPEAVEGMARFGINPENTYGVSIPTLREMSRRVGADHQLADRLWNSGVHEARILAAMVDRPAWVDEDQMERWVLDFDSWDVCDQCCNNLFRKVPWAHKKAVEWAGRQEEFVKRAGFVLMACLAVHDKGADDETFARFFDIIRNECEDSRNFVKKAVNWALRQIGKRNRNLNERAVETARKLLDVDSKAARWIAQDALRELTGDKVRAKLGAISRP